MPSTTKTRFTISLPRALVRGLEAARRETYRSRSAVIRDALRSYLRMNALPEERPTKGEQVAIAKGRRAFARGDYASLSTVLHDLDHRPRGSREKGA